MQGFDDTAFLLKGNGAGDFTSTAATRAGSRAAASAAAKSAAPASSFHSFLARHQEENNTVPEKAAGEKRQTLAAGSGKNGASSPERKTDDHTARDVAEEHRSAGTDKPAVKDLPKAKPGTVKDTADTTDDSIDIEDSLTGKATIVVAHPSVANGDGQVEIKNSDNPEPVSAGESITVHKPDNGVTIPAAASQGEISSAEINIGSAEDGQRPSTPTRPESAIQHMVRPGEQTAKHTIEDAGNALSREIKTAVAGRLSPTVPGQPVQEDGDTETVADGKASPDILRRAIAAGAATEARSGKPASQSGSDLTSGHNGPDHDNDRPAPVPSNYAGHRNNPAKDTIINDVSQVKLQPETAGPIHTAAESGSKAQAPAAAIISAAVEQPSRLQDPADPGAYDDTGNLPTAESIHHRTHTGTGSESRPVFSIATPQAGNPAWQADMADRVRWLSKANLSEAEIQLHPEELGKVEIKITTTDDQTTVHFFTRNAQARDLIESTLPRLREMLGNSGLQLQHGDVSHHAMAEGFRHRGNSQNVGSGFFREAANEFGDSHNLVMTQRGASSDRLVDHYV